MSLNKWIRRAAGMALVCASVVAVAPLGAPGAPVASAQATDAGGEFHALTPTRILDTRTSIGGLQGPKKLVSDPRQDKSGEFKFNVLGKGALNDEIPDNADEVLAVVANVTVTEATSQGFVAVFPSDFDFGGPSDEEEGSSLINFTAGTNVANLAIVGVDAAGNFSITGKGKPGTYHVIVDVFGFISTSQYATSGARLVLVEPGRIMDTRVSGGPMGAEGRRTLQVLGAGTLPSELKPTSKPDIVPDRNSVTAVLVNLTLVNRNPGSTRTHVTATPTPISDAQIGKVPSNSNALPNTVKANTTVVPVAADGKIHLFNFRGSLDLVVDVLGYFEEKTGEDAAGDKGRIVPLEAPFRAFDTRETAFKDVPLQHGSEEEWSFDNFVNSVVLNPGARNEKKCPDSCVLQQGLFGTVTAVNLERHPNSPVGPVYTSYLKLTPADADPAEVSNVNFALGTVVPNMSLIKYGKSGDDPHVVKAYNHYGQIDYLLDVYAIVLDDQPA